MSGRRKPKVDVDHIAKKRKELEGKVEGLEGVDLVFASDLLEEYSRAQAMVQALGEAIERDGILINVQKGGANNRHTEQIENPAFATWNKATLRMANLATTCSKFVNKTKDEGDDEIDELAAFNMRSPRARE